MGPLVLRFGLLMTLPMVFKTMVDSLSPAFFFRLYAPEPFDLPCHPHGSHFFRLTNFPDFSNIFRSFPVFYQVHFYLKHGTIFAGFSLLLTGNFPQLFQYYFQFSSIIFSDLSSILGRFPDFFLTFQC